MKVLVIVTARVFKSKLWDKFLQHSDKTLIKLDEIYCTVEENVSVADANVIKFDLDSGYAMVMLEEPDDRSFTTSSLITLLIWVRDSIPFESVYIAARLGSVNCSGLRRDLPGMKIWQLEFLHHYDGSDSFTSIFKALEQFAQTPNEKSFDTTCELIKKIKIETD